MLFWNLISLFKNIYGNAKNSQDTLEGKQDIRKAKLIVVSFLKQHGSGTRIDGSKIDTYTHIKTFAL